MKIKKYLPWGIGLGLVGAALFWPKSSSAAPLPPPGPGPGPGPGPSPDQPPTPDDPAPRPSPSTPASSVPDAPPWDPARVNQEEAAVSAGVFGYYEGNLKPTGNVANWLTDWSGDTIYGSSWPQKIPQGWEKKRAQWEPWVDTWKRLNALVKQYLEVHKPGS